jgi:hypothetical protein
METNEDKEKRIITGSPHTHITPAALTQLELISDTPANETGFIVGQDIGKYTLIEELFPIDFDESTIDRVYAAVYGKIGAKLLGVFFKNREPFYSDWFIEDIIIKIKYPQPEFYVYDVDKKYLRLPEVRV